MGTKQEQRATEVRRHQKAKSIEVFVVLCVVLVVVVLAVVPMILFMTLAVIAVIR